MGKLTLHCNNNTSHLAAAQIGFEITDGELVCTARLTKNLRTLKQCRARLPIDSIEAIKAYLDRNNMHQLLLGSENRVGLILTSPFVASDAVFFSVQGLTEGNEISVALSMESIAQLRRFLVNASLECGRIAAIPVFGL